MNRRSALEFSPGAAGPVLAEDPLWWQDLARCAEVDPEIFFPEKGGSVRAAKRVCRSCEVRDACLGFALENDEKFGIWGGLSERERRRIRQQAETAPWCDSGRHQMTAANTCADGRCLPCVLSAAQLRRRAGASGRTELAEAA